MFVQLFDPINYIFTIYSVPLFLTFAAVLFLGLLVLIREQISLVSISFFLVTLVISVWFFAFSLMYCATEESVALWWAKAAYLGIPFIPLAIYQFGIIVLGISQWHRKLVWIAVILSIFFSVIAITTDWLISGLRHYWWGYYPQYGWLSGPFLVFFFGTMSVYFYSIMAEYRTVTPGTTRQFRFRAFMLAFFILSLGSIDFIAKYGISVYPFGYVPVLIFTVLATRATWHYCLVDITPSFAAEQIIQTMTEGLLVFDHERIVRVVNQATCDLLKLPETELVGKHISNIGINLFTEEQLETLFRTGAIYNCEITFTAGQKWQVWLDMSASVTRDRNGQTQAVVCIIRNITERKLTEKQIHLLAYYDNLTGLLNRSSFKDLLRRELVYAQRNKLLVGLLFLDLDDFKRINDTLGHSVGDLLLQSFADRLNIGMRNSDHIARLSTDELKRGVARQGGDEFTILLSHIKHAQDATKVAQRIQNIMSRPFKLGPHELHITISIGISIYPLDCKDVDTLLKNADTAMYYAKAQGKNRHLFYSQDMNTTAFEQLTLENKMHKALEREEFLLYYQPKLDNKTGKIIGAEALVRWQHPDRGIVLPSEFIPLAEETGLIVSIGKWVLRTACAQNKAWQLAGFAPINIMVNLSNRQFSENLIETVEQALNDSKLAPHYLDLEITESLIMQNVETNIETLHKLKAMGIRISVDDFGAGNFSLSYLKRLPLDYLKIDRSFIRDVITNPDDAAIITAIIAMAHNLKLKVIAEGVETEQQLAFLLEHGCDEVQGYLFSQPIIADKFTQLLLTSKHL